MEKNQYSLCLEVLRRFNKANILKDVVLIGSWCLPFYKSYFSGIEYQSSIKTRDMDFLVPTSLKKKVNVDLPDLLKDLGFIVGFKGSQGYIKLEHPDLVIEFLVPEKGRGGDGPFFLPQLGLNAQPLRFLDFLFKNTIIVSVEGIPVTLPHPINFALHKLIIFQRRKNSDKITKDREQAIKILNALIKKGEAADIKDVFCKIPKSWQQKISLGLEELEEYNIIQLLK